jgi:gamma-glutamyltranspeptidase
VYCELRVPRRTVDELRSRGMEVVHSLHNYDPAFASVQMALNENGRFRGGSDPRRLSGSVAVVG